MEKKTGVQIHALGSRIGHDEIEKIIDNPPIIYQRGYTDVLQCNSLLLLMVCPITAGELKQLRTRQARKITAAHVADR